MTSYVHHHLDVYDADLYLVRTKKQWKALRKDLPDLPKLNAGHAASCTSMEAQDHFALVFYFRTNDVNTVAHEAFHGAGMLLDAVGQEYESGSEAMAWLVGWLAQWSWEHTRDDE